MLFAFCFLLFFDIIIIIIILYITHNILLMKYSVIKRNGHIALYKQEKLAARLRRLSYKLTPELDIDGIVSKITTEIAADIETRELDLLASHVIRYYGSHPDYQTLASRVRVARLHKETNKDLHSVIALLDKGDVNITTDPKVLQIMKSYIDDLNGAIVHERDYAIGIDALENFERGVLASKKGKVVERPSHMIMRLAVDRHAMDNNMDVDKIIATYHTLCKETIG